MAAGKLNISINSESISAYLEDSSTVKAVIAGAREGGLMVIGKGANAISKLISTAESLGLKTIEDLDNTLKGLLPRVTEYFKFITDFVLEKRDGKGGHLVYPAVVRYLLVGFAPSGKRLLINKESPPAIAFGEAMAAYDRQRKSAESKANNET